MWKVKYVQQCFLPCQRIVCKRNARTRYDERKELCRIGTWGSHMVVLSSSKVVAIVLVDQLKRLKGSTTVLSGSSSS